MLIPTVSSGARRVIAILLTLTAVEVLWVWPFGVVLPVFVSGTIQDGLFSIIRAFGWVLAWLALGAGVWSGSLDTDEERSIRWLWATLDTFSEGVVAFDRSGRVVFANRAGALLLGHERILVGTPMSAFADVPKLRSTVASALLDDVEGTAELKRYERVVLVRAAPVNEGALLLLVDVTVVRAASEREAAFVADAAHELRTPLTAMGTSVEALQMGAMANPAVATQMLATLERQTARMRTTVEDLLFMAKAERTELSCAPDSNWASAVLAALQELGAEASVETDLTTAFVTASPAHLQRMVRNLVENALRYAPGSVQVRLVHRGRWVRLEVIDHGPGIADVDKDRVFSRFYRVDQGRARALGGTGLGLAIVSRFAIAAGGLAFVDDTPGGGATLVVELPAAARAGEEEEFSLEG